MRIFERLEDIAAAQGEHLGYSSWLDITQERIDAFADATEDHQWIHVDPHAAAAGPFGATIAHGYLTLALLPALLAQILEIRGAKMVMNYGTQKVRFLAPVPVDSRVRLGLELQSTEQTATGLRIQLEATLEIEGVDRPALVAEVLYLAVP
ncbi:MaoC family dehydratase [Gephyromycinifex aptenodytis]|uniref:MaoC family dehydratase n=1 Tax=Gephyromycinifex aptenodytis TaxID=2716227 RepID=UPI001446039C|nr:MaoC family dehydratase [Gephyromycinifex aptenodytis]